MVNSMLLVIGVMKKNNNKGKKEISWNWELGLGGVILKRMLRERPH